MTAQLEKINIFINAFSLTVDHSSVSLHHHQLYPRQAAATHYKMITTRLPST